MLLFMVFIVGEIYSNCDKPFVGFLTQPFIYKPLVNSILMKILISCTLFCVTINCLAVAYILNCFILIVENFQLLMKLFQQIIFGHR